jgi:sterol desaturase/sphingolipid hydroxylase (fatty acid hydroxylase superfamily)
LIVPTLPGPALPDPVTWATPGFVLLVVLEAVLTRAGTVKGSYETRDTAASLAMGFGSLVAGVFFGGLGAYAVETAYRFHLFEIGFGFWAIVTAFLLDDFVYYWTHRIGHRSRWFWASHVIHHSSQHYNLSTALRQTWTGPVSGLFLLKAPLALLGFHPALLLFVAGLNLVYQFWIHTEAIGRLPAWVEAVFNTPSHHRVHHSRDTAYLDRNYAGVLILWDRWFGTFVPEDDSQPRHYGLVKNIGTFNPLRVASHEFIGICQDLARPGLTFRQRLAYLFAPPGWSHDGSRVTTDMLKARAGKGALNPSWARASAPPS